MVYHLLLYIIGLTTLTLVKQQQAILYVDGLYHPFTIALVTSTMIEESTSIVCYLLGPLEQIHDVKTCYDDDFP